MNEEKIPIYLEPLEAENFILFQKYYLQFQKMLDKGVFEKEFTGRVVLDVLNGDLKNLQKITNFHFEIRI